MMFKKRMFHLLLCFIVLCSACNDGLRVSDIRKFPDDTIALATFKSAEQDLNKFDYQKCVDKLQTLDISSDKYPYYFTIIHALMGEAQAMNGEGASAYSNLVVADSVATYWHFDTLRSTIKIGFGILAHTVYRDRFAALEYFIQGINIAADCGALAQKALAMVNAASLLQIQNDMSGLPYAEECYSIGVKMNNAYLKYCGAITTAEILIKQGRYTEAARLLDESEAMAMRLKITDYTELYTAKGMLAAELNFDQQAQSHFEFALSFKSSAMPDYYILATEAYAEFLLSKGKVKTAIKYLDEALVTAQSSSMHIFDVELYALYIKAYKLLNDYNNIAKFSELRIAEMDRVYRKDVKEIRKTLIEKYESESEMLRKESELRIQKNRVLNSAFILLSLFVVIALLVVSFVRKEKMYKQLVLKELDWSREKALLHQRISEFDRNSVEKSLVDEDNDEKISSDTSDKILFDKIDALMREQKLYRDPMIGRDMLAELTGTNRTYVSRAINGVRGVSISKYVASYRLLEASKILSDKNDTRALKQISSDLGFSSLSTFYNLFKDEYKMPPDKFRKYALGYKNV